MKRILVLGAIASVAMSTLVSAGYEVTIERDMGYKLAGGTLSKVGTTGWDYGFAANTSHKYFEPIIEGVEHFWPEATYAVMTMTDGTSYLQGKGMPYNIHNLTELPFSVADFASDGARAFFLTTDGELKYTLPQMEMYTNRYDDAAEAMGRDIAGNIVDIEAGAYNVGLLTDEGVLYTYGENRIGVNGNMDGANRFAPVDNILAPVVSFSGDASGWIALDMNGTVWMWGSNSNCQMTNVVQCQTSHLTPQAVGNFPDAIKVQVTGASAYVLESDGDLFMAGAVGLSTLSTSVATDWLQINSAITKYNNDVTDIVAESSVVYVTVGNCLYGKGSYHAGIGDDWSTTATTAFFEVECGIDEYEVGIVPETPIEELSCPVDVPGETVYVEVPVVEYVDVLVDVPGETVYVDKEVIKYVEVTVPVIPSYTYAELKQLLKEKRKELRKAKRKAKKQKDNNGHGNGDEHGGEGKYDTTNPGNSKKH